MLGFILRKQSALQHRVAQYLLIKDLKRLLKTETDLGLGHAGIRAKVRSVAGCAVLGLYKKEKSHLMKVNKKSYKVKKLKVKSR